MDVEKLVVGEPQLIAQLLDDNVLVVSGPHRRHELLLVHLLDGDVFGDVVRVDRLFERRFGNFRLLLDLALYQLDFSLLLVKTRLDGVLFDCCLHF